MSIWTSTIWPSTTGVMRTAALAEADYHRRRPTARQLDAVFWLEEERVVSEDWVVRYKNRLLQLERQSQHWAPAKSRVLVRENEAGEVGDSLSRPASGLPRVEGLDSAGRGKGRCPFPRAPFPDPKAEPSSSFESSLEKRLFRQGTRPLFRGSMKPQPRGHFYCGQDGDISNVV